MAFVSVREAASLTGKSTQTLYRHIQQGKLSQHSNGKIDTSELLRVYGELQGEKVSSENHSIVKMSSHETENEKWLKSQIAQLQQDIRELKAESLEREKRLMALIEHQQGRSVSSTGFWDKIFK
jgi:predicted transcriptional regulator